MGYSWMDVKLAVVMRHSISAANKDCIWNFITSALLLAKPQTLLRHTRVTYHDRTGCADVAAVAQPHSGVDLYGYATIVFGCDFNRITSPNTFQIFSST